MHVTGSDVYSPQVQAVTHLPKGHSGGRTCPVFGRKVLEKETEIFSTMSM